MAGGAQQDDDQGITAINVTPLVDIMLVLLIIFMVTSAYIVKPSIEVDLPKAAAAGETAGIYGFAVHNGSDGGNLPTRIEFCVLLQELEC